MYSDDIDLSFVVSKTGKSNYYFHETTVMHYKGESTIKDGTYMKRFQEAMNFFYNKHFSTDGLQSFFFTFFMKMGIVFFSFIKKFQGQPKFKIGPNCYELYSSSAEMAKKLTAVLQKKVSYHDLKTEKEVISYLSNSIVGAEVILDNEFISFKECIAVLESSINKGFTFKIIPKNANFLVGSNNSNERGEVIKIE